MNIPTIDISHADSSRSEKVKAGKAIIEAFEDTGFCKIVGHHITDYDLAGAYAATGDFFAHQTEFKKLFSKKKEQLGYFAFGTEHAKDSHLPDLKEFFHVRSSLDNENPWPNEEFRRSVQAMFYLMLCTAEDTLGCIDEVLGTNFEMSIIGGNSTLRLLHYPSLSDGLVLPCHEKAVRAAPHEDINLITFLPAATDSGLELLTKDGTWEAVKAEPDELIVNVGDMLQMATNGRFKSTTHRVVNPDNTNKPRYSMPFFAHPTSEMSLGPMTAGEYLEQRLKEIGVK